MYRKLHREVIEAHRILKPIRDSCVWPVLTKSMMVAPIMDCEMILYRANDGDRNHFQLIYTFYTIPSHSFEE